MGKVGAGVVLGLLAGQACGPRAPGGTRCLLERTVAALPAAVRESSGVVASRRHPDVFWTVDDSGPSVLFAVHVDGTLLGTVEVPGGLGRDREALSLGPCGAGDCLYVADVGDNDDVRTGLAVYRFPEPRPADGTAAVPDVFRFTLPDGPRDIEAAFLLPGERLHVVTKGRSHPPTVYRYPGPLRPTIGFLDEVQTLEGGPRQLPDRITGADASADGRVVVLRSYRRLALHRIVADTLVTRPDVKVDLLTLREPQGEGVALGADGRIVLTGEAGPMGRRGSIAVLRCGPPFPGAPPPRGGAPPSLDLGPPGGGEASLPALSPADRRGTRIGTGADGPWGRSPVGPGGKHGREAEHGTPATATGIPWPSQPHPHRNAQEAP